MRTGTSGLRCGGSVQQEDRSEGRTVVTPDDDSSSSLTMGTDEEQAISKEQYVNAYARSISCFRLSRAVAKGAGGTDVVSRQLQQAIVRRPCLICGHRASNTLPQKIAGRSWPQPVDVVRCAHLFKREYDAARFGVRFDIENFLPLCGSHRRRAGKLCCHNFFDEGSLCIAPRKDGNYEVLACQFLSFLRHTVQATEVDREVSQAALAAHTAACLAKSGVEWLPDYANTLALPSFPPAIRLTQYFDAPFLPKSLGYNTVTSQHHLGGGAGDLLGVCLSDYSGTLRLPSHSAVEKLTSAASKKDLGETQHCVRLLSVEAPPSKIGDDATTQIANSQFVSWLDTLCRQRAQPAAEGQIPLRFPLCVGSVASHSARAEQGPASTEGGVSLTLSQQWCRDEWQALDDFLSQSLESRPTNPTVRSALVLRLGTAPMQSFSAGAEHSGSGVSTNSTSAFGDSGGSKMLTVTEAKFLGTCLLAEAPDLSTVAWERKLNQEQPKGQTNDNKQLTERSAAGTSSIFLRMASPKARSSVGNSDGHREILLSLNDAELKDLQFCVAGTGAFDMGHYFESKHLPTARGRARLLGRLYSAWQSQLRDCPAEECTSEYRTANAKAGGQAAWLSEFFRGGSSEEGRKGLGVDVPLFFTVDHVSEFPVDERRVATEDAGGEWIVALVEKETYRRSPVLKINNEEKREGYEWTCERRRVAELQWKPSPSPLLHLTSRDGKGSSGGEAPIQTQAGGKLALLTQCLRHLNEGFRPPVMENRCFPAVDDVPPPNSNTVLVAVKLERQKGTLTPVEGSADEKTGGGDIESKEVARQSIGVEEKLRTALLSEDGARKKTVAFCDWALLCAEAASREMTKQRTPSGSPPEGQLQICLTPCTKTAATELDCLFLLDDPMCSIKGTIEFSTGGGGQRTDSLIDCTRTNSPAGERIQWEGASEWFSSFPVSFDREAAGHPGSNSSSDESAAQYQLDVSLLLHSASSGALHKGTSVSPLKEKSSTTTTRFVDELFEFPTQRILNETLALVRRTFEPLTTNGSSPKKDVKSATPHIQYFLVKRPTSLPDQNSVHHLAGGCPRWRWLLNSKDCVGTTEKTTATKNALAVVLQTAGLAAERFLQSFAGSKRTAAVPVNVCSGCFLVSSNTESKLSTPADELSAVPASTKSMTSSTPIATMYGAKQSCVLLPGFGTGVCIRLPQELDVLLPSVMGGSCHGAWGGPGVAALVQYRSDKTTDQQLKKIVSSTDIKGSPGAVPFSLQLHTPIGTNELLLWLSGPSSSIADVSNSLDVSRPVLRDSAFSSPTNVDNLGPLMAYDANTDQSLQLKRVADNSSGNGKAEADVWRVASAKGKLSSLAFGDNKANGHSSPRPANDELPNGLPVFRSLDGTFVGFLTRERCSTADLALGYSRVLLLRPMLARMVFRKV